MSDVDPFEQVSDAAARLSTLVRSVPPESLDVPVATDGRTVEETIHHLYGEFGSVADAGEPRAGIDPSSIADELPQLAHSIRDRFEPLLADLGPGVYGAPAYVIGETLVHGDQIACVVGDTAWYPTYGDVIVLWKYGIPLLQGLLSPDAADVSESWDIRSETDDGRLVFTIDNGNVSEGTGVEVNSANRHELTIQDSAAWVLEFPMQRRAPSDPDTALLVSRFTKP